MNISEITRIHEELIPKKTEFIKETNYTKKLSLRLENQRKRNTIKKFTTIFKKSIVFSNKNIAFYFMFIIR